MMQEWSPVEEQVLRQIEQHNLMNANRSMMEQQQLSRMRTTTIVQEQQTMLNFGNEQQQQQQQQHTVNFGTEQLPNQILNSIEEKKRQAQERRKLAMMSANNNNNNNKTIHGDFILASKSSDPTSTMPMMNKESMNTKKNFKRYQGQNNPDDHDDGEEVVVEDEEEEEEGEDHDDENNAYNLDPFGQFQKSSSSSSSLRKSRSSNRSDSIGHFSSSTSFIWGKREERLSKKLKTLLKEDEIEVREGPGKTQLAYIAHNVALDHANDIFGFNGWSFQVISMKDHQEDAPPNKYKIGTNIWGRMVILRYGISRDNAGAGTGTASTYTEALEMARKTAISDCQKRCLREFGPYLGNCLYDRNYAEQLKEQKKQQRLLKR